MPGKIQAEIGQSKAFHSLEQEAYLNIHRTAGLLDQAMSELLKPHGLTSRQYNVLRILRGAGECGASCKEIAARMITPDPDVTRLVDRMEGRGLVTRGRSQADRRVVAIRITEEGLELLRALDNPVEKLALRSMGALNADELRELIGLLERLRGRA